MKTEILDILMNIGNSMELKYICDLKRHLICEPYSEPNLHIMAKELGIGKWWFHNNKHPHYDIPIKRKAEIEAKCTVVSSKEIARIINGSKDFLEKEF